MGGFGFRPAHYGKNRGLTRGPKTIFRGKTGFRGWDPETGGVAILPGRGLLQPPKVGFPWAEEPNGGTPRDSKKGGLELMEPGIRTTTRGGDTPVGGVTPLEGNRVCPRETVKGSVYRTRVM